VAGAGPRCQGRRRPSAFAWAGLGATFAMVAPFDASSPWWPGCGAWPGGLRSTAGMPHRPAGRQRLAAAGLTAITTTSTPAPSSTGRITTHAPPIRSALETSQGAAGRAFDRLLRRWHIGHWREATPDRAGLLAVLATSIPTPRRADRMPWCGGGHTNAKMEQQERSIAGAGADGGNRSDCLMPSARVAPERRPRTAQPLRPRSLALQAGRDSDTFTATPYAHHRANPRLWRLIVPCWRRPGRSVEVPSLNHRCERFKTAKTPWYGGGVLCVRELRARRASASRPRRKWAAACGGRWLKGTLFAPQGRSERNALRPETGLRWLSRSSCA